MPKGADLHTHLAGAVYAESFIREAAEDNLCVNSKTLVLYKTAATTRSLPPQPVCGEEGEPAADALTNQKLYDQLINVFSMRTFVPTRKSRDTITFSHPSIIFRRQRIPAHGRMGRRAGQSCRGAKRAIPRNHAYAQLRAGRRFGREPGAYRHADGFRTIAPTVARRRLGKIPARMRAEFDEGERRRRELERCGASDATPACNLQVRFLYQVLRALPSPVVFIQLLCGFELASADSLVVGINMVQPEDWRVSLANYRLQMRMVHALHLLYPKVHITLHAGELAPGLVPPDDLRFHIRAAIDEAHAERIGHGVDVMQEERPYDLLKEMAAKRVMTEINLTSNDVILNVKGADHPLPMYRLYHVPVALSTDDEGVSRINLTHEYVRAAMTYPLSYSDLKQMVRTGLEHSFLPGDSLWDQPGPWESYTARAPRAGLSLAARKLRGHARRCWKAAKRRGSNSSWNAVSMLSKIRFDGLQPRRSESAN